ncbi:uncharacterized protein LOC62_02G002398 [Vanrija pseudolonga]|uniref:Uncharacterized protein n=1 Tax=Vanrija pseudolonga TaxID=143232 RepID=A0AAF0Y2B0_9TREE|nr:hypothetical protein LOC62_02G002398 [Vanrija pseudolonga]
MPLPVASLHALFGLSPGDATIASTLTSLFGSAPDPEVKAYPDATYHNYYPLGVSLCFTGAPLALDSIDIFNPPPGPSKSTKPTYSPAPALELCFAETEVVLPPRKEGEAEFRYPRPERFEVVPATKGRDLVRLLGEPSRKGSGGWVGVWLEWGRVGLKDDSGRVEVGIMLELSDPKGAEQLTDEQRKKGAGGVWDRAAGWAWGSLKVFRPVDK